MTHFQDQEWIRRLKKNDPEALNALWEMIFKYSFIIARKRDVYDEAVIHQVALQSWQRVRSRGIEQFRYECRFTTFCWTVITRELWRELKKVNRISKREQPMTEVLDEQISDDDQMLNGDDSNNDNTENLLQQLPICLKALKERERLIFEMRHVQNLEPQAVAEELGLERNHVNVILHRARLKLKRCLENAL